MKPYKSSEPLSESFTQLVLRNGRLVEQVIRRPINGATAFIDQLTFVVHRSTFKLLEEVHGIPLENDACYAMAVSYFLEQIFGFGLSHDRGKGANFYKTSYNIGSRDISYGIVAMGSDINRGNRETICVELTATGLGAAKSGWEHRLHHFANMRQVVDFKFTRMDIAHDFIDGGYTIDNALEAYYAGRFTSSFTTPRLRKEGLDWDNDTRKGRTLYVGSRQSSRMLRVYEKGMQLGDEQSPWVRVELELRNHDLVIPVDALLHAGDYFASSYEELSNLIYTIPTRRIEAKKRTVQSSIEHAVKYLRIQGSKAINLLLEHGKTAQEIISIFDPKAGIPEKTHPGRYFCELLDIDYIHRRTSTLTV